MSSYIKIYKKRKTLYGSISITGSKSISNRLLILKAIYTEDIHIDNNISNCEDTKVLKKSLNSSSNLLDIHHAGTAMRFLTSYFSIQEGKEVVLTGSNRMKERPIYVLVEALKKLGAEITYLEKVGYPPIKIIGKKILGGKIDVNAKISSQYISSLMLIASKFKMGLKIFLKENITSIPYIKMTFNLLTLAGITATWKEKVIHIHPGKEKGKKYFSIESDWSSASYYYSMATISKKSHIILKSYNNESLQGDKEVTSIYEKYFGISTIFDRRKIILNKKFHFIPPKFVSLDLNKTPDLAQTIVVTCAVLGIKCCLKGLETLKIKETDRLQALRNELFKFGIKIKITSSCLEIIDFIPKKIDSSIRIKTYQDHRMAMAFSPFGLYYSLQIENPKVVEKSYPNFWIDLQYLGFLINFYEE
ncbi:MAG: 3-phosphoshikimate 1-carboxyvinyltransferase [Flavobacteriales bacterium]|jgi:3-phosphoshikimate 1-carboxyvinyltransferase|uniref:3-phosphoshikimate 1-carboxyvinyltransferase n=1 Tax=Blattabacterium sp. (Mastotermes darwiniensis) TaxID=39768 RepID=UPI000231DFAF|nr:3-phosphoshikimate 1-carboxyvinyltransferase [Blattabacterium sp. (Mastotermes darwiniensis)]AER40455.1 5-enolpyruvyl shikimate-3-phosphate synthase [Blattabacterium sp. (Mastotermes darwiniensis) str. MADAR]MDR1805029.1 3-phosphoshikimate 1-carboxyvinyltransferase [Flavobacteriales bacterium]